MKEADFDICDVNTGNLDVRDVLDGIDDVVDNEEVKKISFFSVIDLKFSIKCS